MTGAGSGLVARHVDFLEALRAAGVPVSLAEDLDAVAALSVLPWDDRATVRDAYAATLVKRQVQRPTFDALFDLWFPRLVGRPASAPADSGGPEGVKDGPAELVDLRDRLADTLASGGESDLADLAVEAVERFGEMPGRAPGLSGWSAYTTLRRVSPDEVVDRVVAGLLARGRTDDEARRAAARRVGRFTALVEADARRRIAEEKGPGHLADVAVRPTIDRLDFTSARADDLARMRREIQPLARRLATRLTREQHARRRGPLDVRRTLRASLSSGGVPLTTHHRPRRPRRSELVVLCDVSGSVAGFASFTLLLVFALREQFGKVRAFTFVDRVHEVTHHFRQGADPERVLADLAASSAHAARFGRTDYGRAFTELLADHADALGPRTSLLVLGDARSNYSDLALPALRALTGSVRHAWWLNPEHPRHWDTGDSAAGPYREIVPMVECRNLTQLGEFVHDLV
ncbi:vWA domain-containing protein [Nocardioides sp. GXQ0305]|uniref:vWA domain-containing protein n=1 Tax=Nocardioides sp. GXQ0305 TaxID=3423912 RepID=UPI003D7DCF1E